MSRVWDDAETALVVGVLCMVPTAVSVFVDDPSWWLVAVDGVLALAGIVLLVRSMQLSRASR